MTLYRGVKKRVLHLLSFFPILMRKMKMIVLTPSPAPPDVNIETDNERENSSYGLQCKAKMVGDVWAGREHSRSC